MFIQEQDFNLSIMKYLIIGVFLLCSIACFSQKPDSVQSDSQKKIYRASATRINDLVRTNPNEIKSKKGKAISDDKGLYFINPMGKDKNKSTQIWTQGETESNSV